MRYVKNYCEEKEISTSKLNEAQKTLYYIAENMKMDKSINEKGYKHFQMAIKALEQTRWIPVSERLPEKNMACLVAVGKFNLTQIAMYSDLMGTIDHRIFYRGDVGNNNFENITEYVKAWMPLPKRYEPQERSEE